MSRYNLPMNVNIERLWRIRKMEKDVSFFRKTEGERATKEELRSGSEEVTREERQRIRKSVGKEFHMAETLDTGSA